MLKKEQYDILQQYKEHFATAKSGYFRGVYHKDVEVMRPIYESFGKRLGSENCGSCVLTMLIDLGTACDQYELQHPDLKTLLNDIKKSKSEDGQSNKDTE